MTKESRMWINKGLLVRQALVAWVAIFIGGFIFATLSVLLSVYRVNKEKSISIPLMITGVSILAMHVFLYRYENKQAKRVEEKTVKVLQKKDHITVEDIQQMVEVYNRRLPRAIDSTEPIVAVGWGHTISKELQPLVAA